MPEIKHQFSSGRMNLDLDERLVPNGEYKEAFNIQVSSSEGSNVGVLQNLLSNQQVDNQTPAPINNRNYTYGCIGSISNEANGALYWFVRPDWYTPTQGFEFFEGIYNTQAPFLNDPTNSTTASEVNGLWQWKFGTLNVPGSYQYIVETTIGQDMILEYTTSNGQVTPVLVDQFEVICGVVDGYYILPTYTGIGSSFQAIEHGVITLQVDSLAWQAINVGWVMSGFTRSIDNEGNSPILINTNTIEVIKKFELDGEYYIDIQDTTSDSGNDFDGFLSNIVVNGIGPAGKLKALYFQNPNPITNFRPVRHITGINIIDNMLFWTDDYNEPKKINIPRSRAGTSFTGQFHTVLDSAIINAQNLDVTIPLKEEHATVIRKSPNNPLALELITGREQGVKFDSGQAYYESYTGTITTGALPGTQTDDIIEINGNTTVQTLGSLNVGDTLTVRVSRDAAGHDTNSGHNINWKWGSGHVMVLKEFDDTNTDPPSIPLTDYTIKATIDNISGGVNVSGIQGLISVPGNNVEVTMTVTAITGTPPVADSGAGNTTGELQYLIDKFDQDKNIFEFKYPRFGYRYKYEDGEYSHFSPFTEPAFVPGGFDYHPKKGYNLGMANRIEQIAVKNFVPDDIPLDVVEVDILYKDDSSPIIYVVDTLTPEDEKHIGKPTWCHEPLVSFLPGKKYNYWELNSYLVTDEQIKYILPENQLLRIYDNVPRKALAQDITGNRIVYGNYLQNFDLKSNINKRFWPEFYSFISDYYLQYGNNIKDRSIKSLREYQLGVVFIDEFGRETPVLSTTKATFKVPKALSPNNNRLTVGMKFDPPSGYFAKMEYYKFFIKETSGQWYNMAMDRWYDASDGNVWMSFPSADRDKLTIDDFLILKKAADTNDPVIEHPARYKVLAIENEAPDFIKRTYTLVDYRSHNNTVFNIGATDIPRSGVSTFELNFSTFYNTHVSNLHDQFLSKGIDDFYVQFEEAGEISKKYRISSITSDILYDTTSGTPTNLSSAKYYIKTAEVLAEDVNMILDDPTGLTPTTVLLSAKMRLYRMKPENKPEFDGRFFVKIFTDDVYDQYVKSNYNPETDVDYFVSASVKLNYMNELCPFMHEGNGDYFKDGNLVSYHAGTGFPTEPIPVPIRSALFGTSHDADEADSWAYMNNAYSKAHYTGQMIDAQRVRLGLRHFAPYFRTYPDHAQNVHNPMDLSFTTTNSVGADEYLNTQYHIPNPNTSNPAGGPNTLLGDIFHMTDFDPLYKFNWGTSTTNDTKWREEYNNYTTIPHKSFSPVKYAGNFGSSPHAATASFGGGPHWEQNAPWDAYGIPQSQFLWDTWWHTNGDKKSSDKRARETEVWYINAGYVAGKEYYTNDKKLGTSQYGPQQGHGITIGSNKIFLEISLGGLWGEPKLSMDGDSGQMIDPGFYNIGKVGGNASYQDTYTVDVVKNLVPGTYCKFKEDPTQTMYQIVGVKEENYINYARFEKDDEGDWWIDWIIDDTNSANLASFTWPYYPNDGSGMALAYFGNYFASSVTPDFDAIGNPYNVIDEYFNTWAGDFWSVLLPDNQSMNNAYGCATMEEDYNITNIRHEIALYYDSGTANNGNPYTTITTNQSISNGRLSYSSWTKNQSLGSQLSCNFTKSWKLELVNVDSPNPTDMPWDPTGTTGVTFGPIANGAEIDIVITAGQANGTSNYKDLNSGAYAFVTSSITNSDGEVLKKGMIVTKYDSTGTIGGGSVVEFGKDMDSTNDHLSKLYLQVVDIAQTTTGGGNDAWRVELGGYIRPLLVMDTFDFEDGGALRFQQAIMNGYSDNSVAKISINTQYDGDYDTGTGSPSSGSLRATGYTLQFLQPSEEKEVPLSSNPAIWETEPEDGPDLDIYYEASPRIPIELSRDNANDWIPTRYSKNKDLLLASYPEYNGQAIHNPTGSYENSVILTGDPGDGFAFMLFPDSGGGSIFMDLEIVHVDGDILTLRCDSVARQDAIILAAGEFNVATALIPPDPTPKKRITIRRPDGITFTAEVLAHNVHPDNAHSIFGVFNHPVPGGLEPYIDLTSSPSLIQGSDQSFKIKINKNLYGGGKKPNSLISLNWHNCYSFGNGVESNRIRDNFNTPFISNGVRVSTTLSDYEQERRQYGLIYSGLYNSVTGVNNLNQFIQAEKITKEVNPSYGSIQKLHSRDSDLVTFCEDKTLKILANKDAVFNADGNPQLTANQNVLGQTIPFSGEYGISRNPESFASENYRAYFTDKTRGAVLRLSKDGLTPISEAGMRNWFKDNLKLANFIIGSYDDEKQEYNVALKNSMDHVPEWNSLASNVAPANSLSSGQGVVATYDERVKGWVSFKSFGSMESGVSCSNRYYTFVEGILHEHHVQGGGYNTFYSEPFRSQVNVLLNDEPSIIKSFKTIGYEGSQAKVLPHVAGSGEYDDFNQRFGWYSNQMNTNMDEGSAIYFTEKESKWFSRIKGASEDQNPDMSSFSNQGIGFLGTITLV